jgi:uroporphyrinogen decarboxylase
MNKRERLEKTIAGEATDRVPVSLWRHWPGDDQRSADLARSIVNFQKTFDWDFVKVMPASSYCIADYGVGDEWQGNLEGTRTYIKHPVKRSLDWTELRPLDPTRGQLGQQLDCLNLIESALKDDGVPIIATIFSPLAQAKNIAGRELLIEHIRTRPDRVHSGLNVITDSILRFIEALKRTSIDGIFYAVQHASYNVLSEEEYKIFGVPYDRKILEALPKKWWFNMLHLHGPSPMFKLFANYPVQVINWHSRESEPDLAQGKSLFRGVVSGGLSQSQHLQLGTPTTVREAAREAITQTNARRFILANECVTLVTSPQSNLWAAREVVESVKL